MNIHHLNIQSLFFLHLHVYTCVYIFCISSSSSFLCFVASLSIYLTVTLYPTDLVLGKVFGIWVQIIWMLVSVFCIGHLWTSRCHVCGCMCVCMYVLVCVCTHTQARRASTLFLSSKFTLRFTETTMWLERLYIARVVPERKKSESG